MSQTAIFFICAAAGISSGIIYDLLYVVRTFACGGAPAGALPKIITVSCDLAYFVCLAAIFLLCAYFFDFYEVRAYMIVACALGATLYIKSMHLTVAFLVNKVYNRCRKIKKSKEKPKCRTKRRKE